MRLTQRRMAAAMVMAAAAFFAAPASTFGQDTTTDQESMYSLFVTMRVKPDSIAAFRDAMMDVARGSVAEFDCYRYDVLIDRKDSTVFYIFEVFSDREAHRNHTKSEHFRRWSEKGAPLIEEMEIQRMHTLFPPPDGYEAQKAYLAEW